MRIRRPAILGILIAISPVGAAQAGQAEPRRSVGPLERFEAWRAAVARHQPGTIDEAAREIAAWPDERLNRIVDDLRDLAKFLVREHARRERTGASSAASFHGLTLSFTEVQRLVGVTDDEAAAGDVSRLALRAALLHTDITVQLDAYDPLRPQTPGSTRVALLVSDGRQEGVADRGPHWELARDLLDLLPPNPPHAAYTREWYVAAAAFMQSRGRLADLVPHLDAAGRRFPADGEIDFHNGALQETLASPSIQQAVRAFTPSMVTRAGVRDARRHLDDARAAFQRTVERDPEHAGARARLGRVLGALGRDEEAVVHLQRALDAPAERRVQYFAALFLGDVHARLGRADAARQAFERAAALFPRAQSPRLGLSGLARARGDRTAASRILLNTLPTTHEDDTLDPWWLYFTAPFDYADQLLLEWRRSIPNWSRP